MKIALVAACTSVFALSSMMRKNPARLLGAN